MDVSYCRIWFDVTVSCLGRGLSYDRQQRNDISDLRQLLTQSSVPRIFEY